MTGVRLLGDVTLHGEDGPRDLGHRRQRTVFAILAVHRGSVVSAAWLIEQLWDSRPPQRARDTLYSYLSRLRKVLSDVEGMELERGSGGYLLGVEAGDVDMHRFRELAHRAATLPDDEAIPLWQSALNLWNGQPFADVSAPELVRLRETLAGERFAAELELGDALLRTGEHARLLPGLRDRVREHPLDERLAEQYLLALHRGGRSDEALEHFESLRARLASERGTDPGLGIRRLRDRIREGENNSARVETAMVPRQLPGDITGFVGRASTLARLDSMVGTTAVAVIAGTAGVGKTTLAVHWAHRIAERFPDGQLYVNLRGYDPSGTPMAAEEAIRAFLDGFGVPRERIPAEFDAQVAMYRGLLGGRRVLVVLDNASRFEQVRSLLPESGEGMVVLTSRRPLDDSPTFELVALDVLDRVEARDLLVRRVGSRRISAEPVVVDEIIELCARLPIALSIMAARAALRPGHSLAVIAAEIRDRDATLSAFDSGEDMTSPRAIFAWSYQELSPEAAALFRALSVSPGPSISVSAAASLCGLALDRTGILLREVVDAGLLAENHSGRFAFHDLLRTYSRDLGEAQDPPDTRAAILKRLLSWSIHSADVAYELIKKSTGNTVTVELLPGVTVAEFSDQQDAWEWFDTEHVGIVASVQLGMDNGNHLEVVNLACALAGFLERGSHAHSGIAVHTASITAARLLDDRDNLAKSHRDLGRSLADLRQFEAAREKLAEAIELFEDDENPIQQANNHAIMAVLYNRQDRHAEALHHSRKALELFRVADDFFGIAVSLNNVGWHQAHLGNPRAGLKLCQEALDMYQHRKRHINRANALDSLGYIHARLGDRPRAVASLREAVAIFRELGHKYLTADSLTNLGDIHAAADDPDSARAAYREALSILDDIDHPDTERVRARLRELDDATSAAKVRGGDVP